MATESTMVWSSGDRGGKVFRSQETVLVTWWVGEVIRVCVELDGRLPRRVNVGHQDTPVSL